MRVQDIMNQAVKTAAPDTSIREVAIQMCFNKISGMPVVTEEQKIVGIISEKDILHAMYPRVDDVMQGGRVDFEAMETEYCDVVNGQVSELMTSNVFTVEPDLPVLKAASIMFVKKIRRIPVAKDGQLLGIISIGDVHKAVFRQCMEDHTAGVQTEHAA